jgi:hypothetical protein
VTRNDLLNAASGLRHRHRSLPQTTTARQNDAAPAWMMEPGDFRRLAARCGSSQSLRAHDYALRARAPEYMDRLPLPALNCSDLPDVLWLDHDYPRARLEQRLTALSTAGGGWITVARCNDCGQVWRVDRSDGRSVDMAIKVAALDAWKDEDDRAARIRYLKHSCGGDGVGKCIWAGCQNKALQSLAMCAEHAYDRMGARTKPR